MDTGAKLEAHERECAIRYQSFQEKLDHIDKRLWRLEALMMASTQTIVAVGRGTIPAVFQLERESACVFRFVCTFAS